MTRSNRHKSKLLSALLVPLAVFAAVAVDAAEEVVKFEIAEGSAAEALSQFSRQSGLQMLFAMRAVEGHRTQEVLGQYEPKMALEKLLQGTGLKFQFVNETTVLVATDAPIADGTGTDARTGSIDGAKGPLRMAQAEEAPAAGDAAASSAQDAQRAAASSESPADEKLEEITVTAQKRVERLQDVPISMSVLRGDELDRFTGEGVNDALTAVPGVQLVGDFWNGSQVSVRGVAAADGVLSGASPAAYYIDSVPFGFIRHAIGPDTSAYDLERVEALRGPQGTLYGASTLNGVVRVLTRDADLDAFELKTRTSVSTTKDGSENYRGDLAVNLPIIEGKFAARAVLSYADLGGWIDRRNPAQINEDDDVNDATIANFRLKLNAQPTDKLSLGLTAWRSRTDRDSPTLSDEHDLFPGIAGDTPISIDYDILGFKVGYAFPTFSFSSATSYIDFTNRSVFDYSPFGGFPVLHSVGGAEVLSEEFLLNSTGNGVWRWTAGAFYRDAKDTWFQTHPVLFNPPTDYSDTSESFAVFGELTRLFLDGKFELIGGLRYFEDDVTTRSVRGSLAGLQESATFDSVSPRLVLTWHPRDRLTAYASYAEGFRSGSTQDVNTFQAQQSGVDVTLAPAKEDKLRTYEVGVKGSLLEGRFSYDAAAYYTDWQDVQQQIFINFPPPLIGAVYAVVNGESASGPGFDLALTARPLGGLELAASFSWNDLKMDAPLLQNGLVLLDEGDRLRRSAEYTVGASAEYAFPIGANGLEGRITASGNYQSKLLSARDITTAGAASQVSAGDPMRIARASFSVGSPDRWTTQIFVDNLTNDRGTYIEPAGIPEFSSRQRPRMIGVQLEYRFGK